MAAKNGKGTQALRKYIKTVVDLGFRLNDIVGENIGDQTGHSVTISSDGNIVAISSSTLGSMEKVIVKVKRIFKFHNGVWSSQCSINGSNHYDNFGQSVSLSGDGSIIAISSTRYDLGGSANTGLIRIFKNNLGTWEQIGSDIKGTESYAEFGQSISLSGDGSRLAIGAPLDDVGVQSDAGLIEIYENIRGTWTKVFSETGNQTFNAIGEKLGYSVGISDDGTLSVECGWRMG